jgi:hypothetical protein
MSYIGIQDQKASQVRRFSVTGSTSATHLLTWVAANEQSLIVTINGVKQHDDAYTIAGNPTTVTLSSALVSTDKLEVIGIADVGQEITPADNSVGTLKLADDAVTNAKIVDGAITSAKIDDGTIDTVDIADDAIDTDKIQDDAIDTDKIQDDAVDTDKIQDDAVTADKLSATGTSSSSTYLRGDMVWGIIEGSEITSQNTFFKNPNTVTNSQTTTIASTANAALIGPIGINSGVVWAIAGTLKIL